MEWSRIKTIVLIILAITNISLLGFLLQREMRLQSAQDEATAQLIAMQSGEFEAKSKSMGL